MHDRRIEGQPAVFGNAGGLYLQAMTWWDHGTGSIWSQPLGEAVQGKLAGARLDLLPSVVTTWEKWVAAHPQSFLLANDLDKTANQPLEFSEDFVIGVVIGDAAGAYPYDEVAVRRVVNDVLRGYPLVVWAEDQDFRVYLAEVNGEVLEFEENNGVITDVGTGTVWNLQLGIGSEGPLTGVSLQPLPALTAFEWAWKNFYPGAEIYQP